MKTALKMLTEGKSLTIGEAEIVGFAKVLGDKVEHIVPKVDGAYVDLVGTGGRWF